MDAAGAIACAKHEIFLPLDKIKRSA
jgi:hypothetical protein